VAGLPSGEAAASASASAAPILCTEAPELPEPAGVVLLLVVMGWAAPRGEAPKREGEAAPMVVTATDARRELGDANAPAGRAID
jgi:hypothetical protein